MLLGIPGNHDWYDGLDGFGRLFRRSALEDFAEPTSREVGRSDGGRGRRFVLASAPKATSSAYLHLDEFDESLHLVEEAAESLAAILRRSTLRRPSRLALAGYTAVQEASYWALALAPGLDLWGVDRQLRAADFRQRVFFAQRRAEAQPHKFVLVAPDPALAYGEPNEPGMKILESCHFSLAS